MKKQHKAALYCRVSTVHQIDKDSLPVQREALISYATHVLGIPTYEVFTDAGFSGKNTNRPAFQDMLHRCSTGEFTHVLVFKLDRISRSVLDFSMMYDTLQKLSITFVSLHEQFDTSTPMGKAMLTISLAFAQMEREVTSERVTAVLLARAKKGMRNGGSAPLGYDLGKGNTLVINDDEADVVRYIFSLYESRGLYQVMKELNDNHILSKAGKKWSCTSLALIITNPVYKGSLCYNKKGPTKSKPKEEWITIDNVFPAIISAEKFDAAQRKYQEKHTPAKAARFPHLFRSLLYCRCGSSYIYSKTGRIRKDGLRPTFYQCNAHILHWGCDNTRSLSDLKLVPFVFTYIQNMLQAQSKKAAISSPATLESILVQQLPAVAHIKDMDSIFNAFAASYRVDYQPAILQPPALDTSASARRKIEKALRRLKELYLYADDETIISRDEYVAEKKKLMEQLGALDRPAPASTDETLDLTAALQNKALSDLLLSPNAITYERLITAVGDALAADFIHAIISRIDTDGPTIKAITFKNGIRHEFIYKQ